MSLAPFREVENEAKLCMDPKLLVKSSVGVYQLMEGGERGM